MPHFLYRCLNVPKNSFQLISNGLAAINIIKESIYLSKDPNALTPFLASSYSRLLWAWCKKCLKKPAASCT